MPSADSPPFTHDRKEVPARLPEGLGNSIAVVLKIRGATLA
jgi:hypothetical protein